MDTSNKEQKKILIRPILNSLMLDKHAGIGSYSFVISKEIDSIALQIEKNPQIVEVLGVKQPEYYVVKTKTIPLSYDQFQTLYFLTESSIMKL